ncbi:unnamed protein product, partial [Amoebophrya sp. A120]
KHDYEVKKSKRIARTKEAKSAKPMKRKAIGNTAKKNNEEKDAPSSSSFADRPHLAVKIRELYELFSQAVAILSPSLKLPWVLAKAGERQSVPEKEKPIVLFYTECSSSAGAPWDELNQWRDWKNTLLEQKQESASLE